MPELSYFFLFQAALIGFVAIAAWLDVLRRWRAGRGGVTLRVTRSDASIGYFIGAFALLAGVAGTVCSVFDMPPRHKLLWFLLDVVLLGYLCLLNGWFRNKTVGAIRWLQQLEKS